MHPELYALGWAEGMSDHIGAGLEPARVTAVHRGGVVVRGPADPDGRLAAVARSTLRAGTIPVVGDWVAVEPAGMVRDVLPRTGVLRRTDGTLVEHLAAHVDLALVITSANRDLNVRRIERFLALVRDGGVPACVLLTKSDLLEDPVAVAADLRAALGAPVLVVSARTTVSRAARSARRSVSATCRKSASGRCADWNVRPAPPRSAVTVPAARRGGLARGSSSASTETWKAALRGRRGAARRNRATDATRSAIADPCRHGRRCRSAGRRSRRRRGRGSCTR